MTNARRISKRGAAGLLLLTGLLALAAFWQMYGPRAVTVSAGQFPEQLVYARSSDDVINGGVLFSSAKESTNPIAVIWVHGWGVNFYYPTYTMIGRALAERGLTTITVNTRMHDLATSATHRRGKRIRGGGYWGIQSEQTLDLAAWIDFAQQRGFGRVVLAGHSAGWAAVAAYQIATEDPRVAGVVLASGAVRPLHPERDPDLIAQARRLVAAGTGDDLIRLPNRSFPSFISADNLLDQANTPPELLDFFGVDSQNAGMARLACPLLAFFGTRGDVGGEADLELVTSSLSRLSNTRSRVETRMIERADHMYTGEEAQVAQTISDWANRVVLAEPMARR